MRFVGVSVMATAVLAVAANTFSYSASDDSCIGLVGSSDDGGCQPVMWSMVETAVKLAFSALSLKTLFSPSIRHDISKQLRKSRRYLAQVRYDEKQLLAVGSIVATLLSFYFLPPVPSVQRLQAIQLKILHVVLSAALVVRVVDPDGLDGVFDLEDERRQNQLAEQAADEPWVHRVEIPERLDAGFLRMGETKRPDGDADSLLLQARLRASQAHENLRRLQAALLQALAEMQTANQALLEAQCNAQYAGERRRADLAGPPVVRHRLPRRLGLVSQAREPAGGGATKVDEGDAQNLRYNP